MRKHWEAVIGLAGGIAGIVSFFWHPSEHPVISMTSLALGTGLLGLFTGLRFPRRSVNLTPSPPDQEIRVLRDNDEMAEEIRKIVTEKWHEITKVIVIQYSAWNVVSSLKHFAETRSEVDLYIVHPDRAAQINDHQKRRVAEAPEHLDNELLQYPIPGLRKFIYDAPGAVRAILIDRQALFIGAYQYEVAPPLGNVLDSRGKEKPMFLVPYHHHAYKILAHEIEGMVKNWKEQKNSKGQFTAIKYERPARASE